MIVITGTEIPVIKNIDLICIFVTIFDFMFSLQREHTVLLGTMSTQRSLQKIVSIVSLL